MPRQPRWGSSPYTIPPAINRSCLSSISLPSPFGEGYGGEASYITTMPQSYKSFAALSFLVELVGFEPTSKQGNHTLSTRLFQPFGALASKFSSCRRGQARLFPIYLHRLILRFGTTSLERCLVPSSDDGIKPVIYCTSIRQRERNCFRQLNFCSLRLKS